MLGVFMFIVVMLDVVAPFQPSLVFVSEANYKTENAFQGLYIGPNDTQLNDSQHKNRNASLSKTLAMSWRQHFI
jgi:hypothetical protein